jgi:hypothetical protein
LKDEYSVFSAEDISEEELVADVTAHYTSNFTSALLRRNITAEEITLALSEMRKKIMLQ